MIARIWGDLSFEQIGELVEISSSAAHRRFHRALSMLGEMMHDGIEEEIRTDR